MNVHTWSWRDELMEDNNSLAVFARSSQACAWDTYEKFKEAGAEVIGISGDNAASHKAFAEKYKLPFTLLADECKNGGVPSYLFGELPGRQTYVLDKNGVCRFVYCNHIEETLKFLKSSETD